MSGNRDIIRGGLQELSNAVETQRECRVTFEANGREHWLQCTPDRINMDWPFSASPCDTLHLKLCFDCRKGIQIYAWEPDHFVSFTPSLDDVERLVRGIDSVFQDLYELGPNYSLTYRVENA